MDAFFGQLATIIATCKFDTPGDVVDIINNVWEDRPGQGAPFRTCRGLHARAARLEETRAWKEWISRLGIVLKGLRILTEMLLFLLTG